MLTAVAYHVHLVNPAKLSIYRVARKHLEYSARHYWVKEGHCIEQEYNELAAQLWCVPLFYL